MTKTIQSALAPTVGSPRGQITLERTYDATPEELWEMWTTKEGIESWWGPDGFTVTVHEIDLRPGGTLFYSMTATDAPQIEFMKQSGMPLTTSLRMTFTDVQPNKRLAYKHLGDFMPGVEPYEIAHVIEFFPVNGSTRMTLTIDRMHDEHWTTMAVRGWENEMEKLAKAIARRSDGATERLSEKA